MAPNTKQREKHDEPDRADENTVYDTSTPIWSKYYREVRKRVKFPRYYKKALNW